jgi:integrase
VNDLIPIDPSLSLPAGVLFTRWLDEIDAKDDTRDAYNKALGEFVAWLQDRGDLSPALVREWRNGLDGAPATVNLKLSAVRSFFAWAVESGYILKSPASEVRGRTRKGTTTRHKRDELTAEEIKAVMSTCDDSQAGARDRAIIGLMAYTGMRAVEAHRADVADLETKQGRRILWVWGKNRDSKDDFVVIPQQAEGILQAWLAEHPRPSGALFVSLSNRSMGERLSRVAIRNIVKRHFKLAGIHDPKKTTHSLRHSAISAAIRGGALPTQVQSMARHASIDTTMIYYHEQTRLSDPAEDLISYD